MSGLPLPDDPARWPKNPCELLGVAFGAELRDLRRAYTRLIRTYKPEQYPEQFRLIRAAYDSLLPFVRSPSTPADTPAAPGDATPPSVDLPPENSVPRQSEESTPVAPRDPGPGHQETRPPPVRSLEEELDELWNAVIEGDAAAPYQRLVQLSRQYSDKVDIYQRLYWLLSCTPDLGHGDVPADWLVRGLRATRLAGPLRELYRQVVTVNPEEAFSDRFTSLLDFSGMPALVGELLAWRVRASARLGNWEVIAEDVRRLGDWLRREDDKIWLRLLFTLTDNLAWEGGVAAGNLLRDCREEIKRYDHLAREFAVAYDRFDMLMTISPGYQGLRQREEVPVNLLEVIRLTSVCPFSEIRPLLQPILEAVVKDPWIWLDYFDRIQAKAPGALALFGQLLDQYEAELESPLPMEADLWTADDLVKAFIVRAAEFSYRDCRTSLLEMCLREALTPDQVARVAYNLSDAWKTAGNNLARSLATDWPVRYASKAWQLYWA